MFKKIVDDVNQITHQFENYFFSLKGSVNIKFEKNTHLIFCAALFAAFVKYNAQDQKLHSSLDLKLRAAEIAKRAFDHIANEREKLGLSFCEKDIGKTGLIGLHKSIITTNRGCLKGKKATLNPNFAALIIDWLLQIKMRSCDQVALAITGSCPALNICVYAALSAMQIKPAIIASLTSSNWGANDPKFCWLDMEKSLFDAKLIPFRAQLYSVGGYGDCGLNLTKKGADWALNKIKCSDRPLLECKNSAQSIQMRMDFYQSFFDSKRIDLYINVGGGIASVSRREKRVLAPGLNLQRARAEKELFDSVMQRFGANNIPSIHLSNVTDLAIKYRLGKVEDGKTAPIGEGTIFELPKKKRVTCFIIKALALLSSAHAGSRGISSFRQSRCAKRQFFKD